MNDRTMKEGKRSLILLNLPPKGSKAQKHFTD